MFLIPQPLYSMFLNHKDDAIRKEASIVHIRQQNNLDVHDGGEVTIRNDNNYLQGPSLSAVVIPPIIPPIKSAEIDEIPLAIEVSEPEAANLNIFNPQFIPNINFPTSNYSPSALPQLPPAKSSNNQLPFNATSRFTIPKSAVINDGLGQPPQPPPPPSPPQVRIKNPLQSSPSFSTLPPVTIKNNQNQSSSPPPPPPQTSTSLGGIQNQNQPNFSSPLSNVAVANDSLHNDSLHDMSVAWDNYLANQTHDFLDTSRNDSTRPFIWQSPYSNNRFNYRRRERFRRPVDLAFRRQENLWDTSRFSETENDEDEPRVDYPMDSDEEEEEEKFVPMEPANQEYSSEYARQLALGSRNARQLQLEPEYSSDYARQLALQSRNASQLQLENENAPQLTSDEIQALNLLPLQQLREMRARVDNGELLTVTDELRRDINRARRIRQDANDRRILFRNRNALNTANLRDVQRFRNRNIGNSLLEISSDAYPSLENQHQHVQMIEDEQQVVPALENERQDMQMLEDEHRNIQMLENDQPQEQDENYISSVFIRNLSNPRKQKRLRRFLLKEKKRFENAALNRRLLRAKARASQVPNEQRLEEVSRELLPSSQITSEHLNEGTSKIVGGKKNKQKKSSRELLARLDRLNPPNRLNLPELRLNPPRLRYIEHEKEPIRETETELATSAPAVSDAQIVLDTSITEPSSNVLDVPATLEIPIADENVNIDIPVSIQNPDLEIPSQLENVAEQVSNEEEVELLPQEEELLDMEEEEKRRKRKREHLSDRERGLENLRKKRLHQEIEAILQEEPIQPVPEWVIKQEEKLARRKELNKMKSVNARIKRDRLRQQEKILQDAIANNIEMLERENAQSREEDDENVQTPSTNNVDLLSDDDQREELREPVLNILKKMRIKTTTEKDVDANLAAVAKRVTGNTLKKYKNKKIDPDLLKKAIDAAVNDNRKRDITTNQLKRAINKKIKTYINEKLPDLNEPQLPYVAEPQIPPLDPKANIPWLTFKVKKDRLKRKRAAHKTKTWSKIGTLYPFKRRRLTQKQLDRIIARANGEPMSEDEYETESSDEYYDVDE